MEKPSVFPLEQQEKPPVLYHASHDENIEEFTPRQGNIRDPKEGPVIFATPDPALASIFLIRNHNDSWTHIGYWNDTPTVIIKENREIFIGKDTGGVLYELPSNSFSFHPTRGMGEKEWTSTSPVKPNTKTTYPSALEAMIYNGVQVYFVDPITFESIDSAQDHGLAILQSLRSENETRGIQNPLKDIRD